MTRNVKRAKPASSENEPDFLRYCSVCQVPFSCLKISLFSHISSCKVNCIELPECKDALKCNSKNIYHYRDYSHKELAEYRLSKIEQRNQVENKSLELKKTVEIFEPNERSEQKNLVHPTLDDLSEDDELILGPLKKKHVSNRLNRDKVNTKQIKKKVLSNSTNKNPVPSDPVVLFKEKVTANDNENSVTNHTTVQFTEKVTPNTLNNVNENLVTNSTSSTVNEPLKQDVAKRIWKMLLNGNQEVNTNHDNNKRKFGNGSPKGPKGPKICPSYKKVSGTRFAVDAFEFGAIEGVSIYFLTHFHFDHYVGLKKSFNLPLYCTNITANLVKLKIKVDPKHIHIIECNKSIIIDNVEVTAFDANHCPGSVILLFRLPNGEQHLHTGDFRANDNMEKYPLLAESSITNLYLDTTYCNEGYSFPTQEEVIDRVRRKVKELTDRYPRALFVCGSYTIGKEKVFINIIKELKCKLWCDRNKREVLKCLEDEFILSALANSPFDAQLHVLPMGKLHPQTLREYLSSLNKFTHLFAFRPSGWEMSRCNANGMNHTISDKVTIYGVPYSEHSSYTEICKFVKFLKPANIIPTVNIGDRRMRVIIKNLLDSNSDKPKQQTIDKFMSPTKSLVPC